MHAIGNEIARRQPSAHVVYVTTEEFTNNLINSIRYKRTEPFRSQYRSSNTVLLIDDIQFLSGKQRTQEELFHTFNALQAAGRQMVLTCDVEPDQIADLQPRLVTRFSAGLVADLQPPDTETLLAILHSKADLAGLALPSDLARAIAEGSRGSIREVEGMLSRLGMFARVEDKPLTIELARRALPRLFVAPVPVVSAAAIIEMVARLANLRSADLTGHGRSRALSQPRQIAMFLARKHTSLSFPELAREFGNRDHTTIVHGARKIEQEIKRSPDLEYQVQLIEQSLGLRTR
jgi:chromosomal replication initiator protein